ncbi:aspartate ammonia-lyase [Vagococcus coleopterorum]|uniref:Aspartate ammonia-lyase n=1 Tax=Vagococcus coleopterorum TaxID=2714946 RepID=A0A6G8AMI5_9ENTE|nr:aspartate ammonia-lyase [Vagococcus coleopterorum]QIL46162.1 aspartate ammonia-lyase [Vagococcus coleopterorum]
MYREEQDSVGKLNIPKDAYYGVNAQRAFENFQITGQRLDPLFIESLVQVKKAVALANMELGELDPKIGETIVKVADEMLAGNLHDQMIVDPIQGGAGTSSNMNINEVIANRAIEMLGGEKGDYTVVSPNDHVNKGQSTNDVYPTSGKLTMLKLADILLASLNQLADTFEAKAKEFAGIKKMGRTQLSDAVLITVGEEFHAHSTLTKRNIKRLEAVKDEVRALNMGGTAIGTGISAHKDLPQTFNKHINDVTGLGLTVAEDLIDATQNIDCFAVVADVQKTIGLSLSKVANDIRLLSSGPRTGLGELYIPSRQNGSSIMPGKINPVIPEVLSQAAYLAAGNSYTVALAVEGGQLELNAFEPVAFHKIFESFRVLSNAILTFDENCVKGIEVNKERCRELLERSTYLTTDLAIHIGYKEASEITKESLRDDKTVIEVAREHGVSEEIISAITAD